MAQVSIIIPTYGWPTGLQQLLNTLEEQTFKDFEVVVVIGLGGRLNET